ncbi:hypothetical protein T484DRAFT_1840862 [Baffinella frigidus]|nr:hypothetical protein T484DRAFT_1840862 [Cryptophyta sp. CCMP2293]
MLHAVRIMVVIATVVDASMGGAVAEVQMSSGGERRALPTRSQLDASCRPIKAYSTVEVAAWLAARGYNTTAFVAESIDG